MLQLLIWTNPRWALSDICIFISVEENSYVHLLNVISMQRTLCPMLLNKHLWNRLLRTEQS